MAQGGFVTDFMGFLGGSVWIIPNWLIIGLLVLIIIVVMRTTSKDKFKRRDTAKEIKLDLEFLSKTFGTPVNKRLDTGLTKSRYILRQFPILWDINTTIRQNIKQSRHLRAYLKSNPAKKEIIDGKETGRIKKEFEELYALKVCGVGIINETLAKINIGTHFILIPNNLIDLSKDSINIKPMAQPQTQFGVVIYSSSGREYVENIAYKLNRENELDEFVNYIPKQNYLEVKTASAVARARERANIEKEKYRGQVESAEGG